MTTEKQKPESIRQWYDRTTRKWRKGLWGASVVVLAVMGIAYATLDVHTLARLQTFNGALTIPLWGGLWILSFIFMFLIPSREASFRGQEALDSSFEVIGKALDTQMTPAMQKVKELAEKLDSILNQGVVAEFRGALKTMNETATALRDTAASLKEAALKAQADASVSRAELEKTAQDVRKFTEGMQPAIDTFKRLENKIEKEIDSGMIEAFRAGCESVRDMTLPKTAVNPVAPVTGAGPQLGVVPPAAAPVRREPDLDRALKMVSKKPAPAPAASAPGEKSVAPTATASVVPVAVATPVRVPLAVVEQTGQKS